MAINFHMKSNVLVIYVADKYLSNDIENRRVEYFCGSKYIPLSQIPSWDDISKGSSTPFSRNSPWKPNLNLNRKVSLWKGDISVLETDAIVNAANSQLRGGGGGDISKDM